MKIKMTGLLMFTAIVFISCSMHHAVVISDFIFTLWMCACWGINVNKSFKNSVCWIFFCYWFLVQIGWGVSSIKLSPFIGNSHCYLEKISMWKYDSLWFINNMNMNSGVSLIYPNFHFENTLTVIHCCSNGKLNLTPFTEKICKHPPKQLVNILQPWT